MSTRQSKTLGYTYEIAVRDFLVDEYVDATRNGNQYGPKDRGDIGGVDDWTLQCKNVQDDSWGVWFKKTSTQAENNSTRWWAVIRKMRGKAVSESLFTMSLSKGKELMVHLRGLEAENARLRLHVKELTNGIQG